MKKELMACLTVFLFVLSFAQNSYCQEISDSDAEMLVNQEKSESINGAFAEPVEVQESIKAIQSQIGVRGRSNVAFSNNPADLIPLLGTKWQFSYKIGSSIYTDQITFQNTTGQLSSTVFVECTNQYGSSGIGTSGNMTELLGGYGFGVTISSNILDDYYFFKISGGTATGYYSF